VHGISQVVLAQLWRFPASVHTWFDIKFNWVLVRHECTKCGNAVSYEVLPTERFRTRCSGCDACVAEEENGEKEQSTPNANL